MQNDSDFYRLVGVFNDWLEQETSRASEDLAEISRYTLLLPGKRLRPVLCLAVGELLKIPQAVLRAPCLSLEYLHAYSLMHDDLPALDDDDLRRGKPTAHVVHGEAAALLGGDRLHAEAYYLVASAENIPEDVRLSLLSSLSEASIQLCDGQHLDVLSEQAESRKESLDDIRKRHALKTGALIRAAVLAPTYFLASSERNTVQTQLGSFAENFGLLFQITDDILDATSSEEVMGKPLSSDEEKGRATYLSVCGLEGAKAMAQASAEASVRALESFGEQAKFLKTLCNYVISRDR